MTSPIRPANLPPLEGSEQFSFDRTVLEFWQWAMSDLRMNTVRGYLAEFIVATATGDPQETRTEWASIDVLTRHGAKVEVKASGYLQSWAHRSPTTPRWGFKSVNASSCWDAEKGVYESVEPSDRVDAWVFALQTCREPSDYDPLDMSQWKFRVVPHRRLLKLGQLGQHSIGISALEAEPIGAAAVSYNELDRAVRRAVRRNGQLSGDGSAQSPAGQ